MIKIYSIEYHAGSKKELLPNFAPDFPYIASYIELDKFSGHFVPWHWHKEVELFYIKSGIIEYNTPKAKIAFPAGSGGMVNSNVLHMTRTLADTEKNIQLEHIFDTSLLAGGPGSRIEQKYITPVTAAPQIEIIPLFPGNPAQAAVLNKIQESFRLGEQDFGYEMRLRAVLSEIWLQLLPLTAPLLGEKDNPGKANDKIKSMLVYIHEHYMEKIAVASVAAAAFVSQRECFRLFQDCLHMTPVEYIKNYRLQAACQMLAGGDDTITSIAHACGLGSSSYFGKVFREYWGCTPIEYRHNWQDTDK